MSDYIDVGARHMRPWEEIDRETVDFSEFRSAPRPGSSKPLAIDWADENRAWLQLHDAGLLPDGVRPVDLAVAHEQVEKQREAEEFAEAAVSDWFGEPAPEQRDAAEFSQPGEHPDPMTQEDGWAGQACRAYGFLSDRGS